MKKLMISMIFTMFFITGCGVNNSDSENKTNESNKASTSYTDKEKDESSTEEDTTKGNNSAEVDSEKEDNISKEVKEYILNGQGDKPEASKLLWSESFLNNVDIDSVYNEYINSGGAKGDVEGFAKYLTENAPVLSNWQQLFKEEFAKSYEYEIVKIEPLENDLYQVYVKIDGKEVPYVVVSARTGYYHG